MTVYLQVGGKGKNDLFLLNLSNAKNVFARVCESAYSWTTFNQLGTLKGYLKVDDFQIDCDYFEEVISVLYQDIVEALKKNKTNENNTFIEVFNLDSKTCKGTDKYSLLVQDCEKKVTEIERECEEREKQRNIEAVKDLVNKGTTRFFNVKVEYLYQVEKGYIKNGSKTLNVCGKNIEDVKTWIHNKFTWGNKSESFFSELVGDPKIEELPKTEVFACHASCDQSFDFKTTDLT